jgi:hypothetical protein
MNQNAAGLNAPGRARPNATRFHDEFARFESAE